MPEKTQRSPVTRVFAWILVLAGFAAWLFSDTLFPGNSRLYDAIEAGDAGQVRALLADGADPNSQSEPLTLTDSRTRLRKYQMPPLIYALWRGKADVALLLVEDGAEPNAKDRDGKTALAIARGQHMDRVVGALLQKGAHPEPEDPGIAGARQDRR